MKLFFFIIFIAVFAKASDFPPTCYQAKPAKGGALPPSNFPYYRQFCISDVSWQEGSGVVRFDFKISYVSFEPFKWPNDLQKAVSVQVSKILPKEAMSGGRWTLIWSQDHGYSDCNAPGPLRCSNDFDLSVEGINTPNLFFSANANLIQEDRSQSSYWKAWHLVYSP